MTKQAKNTPTFDVNAKTEGFKRPAHVDFMTTEEHKKNKTTGVRQNQNALQWEFWILGEMVRAVSFQEVQRDRHALTKAHYEVFFMGPPK